MVNQTNKSRFMPVVVVPPGETIRENMRYVGMSQKELALRLDLRSSPFCGVNSPLVFLL
jgi:ribosome-binding protein aMBF1 (putative translation factor)